MGIGDRPRDEAGAETGIGQRQGLAHPKAHCGHTLPLSSWLLAWDASDSAWLFSATTSASDHRLDLRTQYWN